MHDGIHVEKAGIPAAVICTDRFLTTATAMAKMWGARGFPIVYTAHPIGSLDRVAIKQRAGELIDDVAAVLTGVEVFEQRLRA